MQADSDVIKDYCTPVSVMNVKGRLSSHFNESLVAAIIGNYTVIF